MWWGWGSMFGEILMGAVYAAVVEMLAWMWWSAHNQGHAALDRWEE